MGQTEWLGGGDEIDQVMCDGLPVFERWFGRPNIHISVDGHGIEGEDFGVQLLGQGNGDGGLSPRGGTGQKPGVEKGWKNPLAFNVIPGVRHPNSPNSGSNARQAPKSHACSSGQGKAEGWGLSALRNSLLRLQYSLLANTDHCNLSPILAFK